MDQGKAGRFRERLCLYLEHVDRRKRLSVSLDAKFIMQLNYFSCGQGVPLIILHGLLGSSDNWATLSKKFSEHFKVFALDLRNHGASPHSERFDYPSMVDD